MRYLLFTTTRCPKCPTFKDFVAENVKFTGQILDETQPDFLDQVKAFNVAAAPTIVILENETEIFRTDDLGELDSFLKTKILSTNTEILNKF